MARLSKLRNSLICDISEERYGIIGWQLSEMSSATSYGSTGPLSLTERAYIVIRDRILKGEIPLGTELSRRKLAADLGFESLTGDRSIAAPRE